MKAKLMNQDSMVSRGDTRMNDEMVEQSALRTSLGVAVASEQLRLVYQPIADLNTGEILGVEALVRWQHPTLGLLTPDTFIPLAEQTGDIDAIGCWVLDTATHQVAAWRQTMAHCENLWVAVNLSSLQLDNTESLAAIQRILADPTAQTDSVVLEVTEKTLASDIPDGIEYLRALRGLGVRIAMDGFGAEFSSFSTLGDVDLPVDILKIDGSVASSPGPDASSGSGLEGVLRLAVNFSLTVIAERIEDQAQLDLLRKQGCHVGQGYLLARPAAAPGLEELLASGALLQHEQATEDGGATEQ